jgi:hypothetical protein
MRRAAATVAALALVSAGAPPGPAAGARPAGGAPATVIDAKSLPLVDTLIHAIGGAEAWRRLPALRFDFVALRESKEIVRRRHWWDKANSRCRVEWTDERGRAVCAVVNLADRTGRSCTAGVPDVDSLRSEHVEEAYGMWVNDTYWLVMPFKLHDEGVRISYDRREARPEGEYDVLALSFTGVGLTPEDRYWLFLNRKTHRIDRWEYVLQDQKPPPQAATWDDWRRVGPVMLPLLRCLENRPVNLRFESVAAPPSFDERLLTDPCGQ